MASPFRTFRKHQKWLIAITGVMAMIAFVFFDPLLGVLGPGGGQAEDKPMVSTTSGTLYQSDLQRMVQTQQLLNEFLSRAQQLAVDAGGQPSVNPYVRYDSQFQVTEEIVVHRMLLTQRAEELGFKVDDRAINQYLQKLTGGAVSGNQLRELVGSAYVGNRRATMDLIFDALRDEILARKLQETYEANIAVTPAQSWEYFVRLNDRVTVEVMPVAVEQFLDQVPNPTDARLREFFEEHKEQYAVPDIVHGVELDSPQPGFRQPARAAFAFVKADYDTIVDQLAEEVTDEEIAKYYEENQRQFVRPQLLDDEPAEENSAEETPAEEPANSEPAEQPTPEQPAANEAEPAPEADAPADETPADEAPANNDEQPAPAAEEAAADESQATFVVGRSQFVALQDEETAATPETPADAAPSDAAPAATADAGEADESQPASAEEAPAEQPAEPQVPATEAQPSGEPQPAAPAETPTVELQYYPLEEVSNDIRREIARQKGSARVQEVLSPLTAQLSAYSRDRIGWSLSQQEGQTTEPPAAPDLKPAAEAAGLDYGQLELVSYFELRETPLGQSLVTSVGQPFAAYAFLGQMNVYRPVTTLGEDGSAYLVWKTEEKPDHTPEFEEVRDQVVHAWKMIEARKLAEQEAEKLAAEAREKNQSLTETFPDRTVTETDPFSWLTFGAVPMMGGGGPQVRLSEVEGVEDAGPAFMEKVVELQEGEVAVAMNHPQTTAYVVRMVNHAATPDALHERFLAFPGPWQQMAQSQNQQQVLLALNQSLAEQANLQWLELPDQARTN